MACPLPNINTYPFSSREIVPCAIVQVKHAHGLMDQLAVAAMQPRREEEHCGNHRSHPDGNHARYGARSGRGEGETRCGGGLRHPGTRGGTGLWGNGATSSPIHWKMSEGVFLGWQEG